MKPATTILAIAVAFAIGTASTATADSLINGSEIADGTITAADLSPATLDDLTPDDPRTPLRRVTIPGYTGTDTTVRINCPADMRAVNGGIRNVSTPDPMDEDGGTISANPLVDRSYPTRNGGWALDLAPALDSPTTLTLYAVCI
jgi:hypothetical protein